MLNMNPLLDPFKDLDDLFVKIFNDTRSRDKNRELEKNQKTNQEQNTLDSHHSSHKSYHYSYISLRIINNPLFQNIPQWSQEKFMNDPTVQNQLV